MKSRFYHSSRMVLISLAAVIFSLSALMLSAIPVDAALTPVVTVNSSDSTSVFGQSVTFTAAVSGSGDQPTGTIQFKIDNVNFGTAVALAGGSATSGANTTLSVGSHTVTAAYSGDANYNSASSTGLNQTVSKASTATTVVSSVNPSLYGQSLTFTATVAAVVPGTGTPAGSVQFKIDNVNFGAAVALAGGSATSGANTTLSAGSHTIAAVYAGNASYNTSSDELTQTVNPVFAIDTILLRPGADGMAYSQTLQASGGVGPYSWVVTNPANLPNGLTLSSAGVLSGTVSDSPGQYTFQVTATDSDSPSKSEGQALTITINSAGFLWDWGYNSSYQLGDNTNTNTNVPASIEETGDIVAVAGGLQHSLALKADGSVWAWGDNSKGQVGNGLNTTSIKTPAQVKGGSQGGTYLADIVAIAAGSYHSLALASDGSVWAWGDNSKGQLGDNTTTTPKRTPIETHGLDNAGYLTGIVAVAAGQYHSLALQSDGSVWAWGDNSRGQIGDNSTTQRKTPVQVRRGGQSGGGTYLDNIVAIAAGSQFCLAADTSGLAYAWGDNSKGQLGDDSTTNRRTPVAVDSLTSVIAVAAGQYHSLALRSNGNVWAWGDNTKGQVGNGSTTASIKTPVQVRAGTQGGTYLTNIATVAAGSYHSLALASDGPVWAWGSNDQSQIGDGTITLRRTPVESDIEGGTYFLSAGANHSLAIVDSLPSVLKIVTTVLEDATEDQSYTANLKARGGTTPYVWAKSSSSVTLPAGLALTSAGRLSGTPSRSGDFSFSIRVTDDIDDTATRSISLTVIAASSGGGGSGGTTDISTVTLSGLSSSSTVEVDLNGFAQSAYTLTSSDSKFTLKIPDGTEMLKSNGDPVASLSASVYSAPPAAPTGRVVVMAYTFGPTGATFDNILTLAFKYSTLPAGVTADSLYVALLSGTQWQKLSSTVDTSAKTVTASIDHFSTYGLLGEVSSTPTPTPTPTPSPTPTPKPTPTTTPTTTPSPSPSGSPTSSPTLTPTTPGSTATPTSPTLTPPTTTSTSRPIASANWGLVIGIVVAVIIIAVIIIVLLQRRRRWGINR